MAEIPQSRHALSLIDPEPLAHRVVVQQKRGAAGERDCSFERRLELRGGRVGVVENDP